MSRLLIISFWLLPVLAALLLVAVPGQGRAEFGSAGLPEIIAPWMQAQGFMLSEDELRAGASDHMPPPRRGPGRAGPSMTPQSTLQVVERMIGAEVAASSALEDAYAARIVEPLAQFGYDMFGIAPLRSRAGPRDDGDDAENLRRRALPAGAVPDDFILGTGDRLEVVFRGQRRDRGYYEISAQGLLLIDDLAPVMAAGRSIGQLRRELLEMLAGYHNTEIFVSLDAVRQIDVLVVGHVARPGRQNLTMFDNVLDALMEAGGIDKTGTLRQIKLVRDGRSTVIDLYGLLLHGGADLDLALRDGDRLVVPPVGPTMAVAGGVKRPGIYELPPHLRGMMHLPQHSGAQLNLEEALALAGGTVLPGQQRFIKLGLDGSGRETVAEITAPFSPVFGNGSILMVSPSKEMRATQVELAGHTRRPGLHALDQAGTLSALLSDRQVFGPDIYPLVGVIARWHQGQMARQLLAFPPLLVASGQFDRALHEGDVVHLFSRAEIRTLLAEDKGAALAGIETAAGPDDSVPGGEGTGSALADPEIRAFLTERAVNVRGAVRTQGRWPVAEGASLENVIAVAGGLSLEADLHNIEVTSALHGEEGQAHGRSGTQRRQLDITALDPAGVALAPGDAVRVNQKFSKVAAGSVLIIGEVLHPGRYDLLPGDKMSDLLARAGGLSPHAYPDGAIFSRESARRAEQARFAAAARELEQALARATAAAEKDKIPDAQQLAMARALAAELRQAEAVGRITVEADPGMLAAQPALDILLESGDRIYVPKRPLTVRVSGEVLSPAALQFRSDRQPRDYIAQAGGFTYHADKDRAFVLYPDGSAQPLQVRSWNHAPALVPPGSTIVVPRDPKPFDFIESARDISQILSNLAITGIFINDIRN